MRKSVLAAFIFISLAFQVAEAQTITNWSAPLYGVRLSIASSGSVMVVGSTNMLHCWIYNSSTSNIEIDMSMSLRPSMVFCVTNNLGKSYTLEPDSEREFGQISAMHLAAGKTYEWSAPVIIGKSIPAGVYHLTGKQIVFVRPEIATNYFGVLMRPNTLEVKIKSASWF